MINALSGQHRLMAQLLCGSGLRLMECPRLRIKDLDFARAQTLARDAKGEKDRTTMIYTHVLQRGAQAVRSPLNTG